MTDPFPSDADGNPLSGAAGNTPRQHSHAVRGSPLERLQWYVKRRIDRTLMPFAEGVRDAFSESNERIAKLEREVAEMRRLLDLQRQISEIQLRLNSLEGDGSTVITSRPTNGAHHHDG